MMKIEKTVEFTNQIHLYTDIAIKLKIIIHFYNYIYINPCGVRTPRHEPSLGFSRNYNVILCIPILLTTDILYSVDPIPTYAPAVARQPKIIIFYRWCVKILVYY